MKPERRSYRRVKSKKIQADVSSTAQANQEMNLNGEILDISRTGLRIKLNQPLNSKIHDKINITLVLPHSGTPFSVHGILINKHTETEYGIHYASHTHESIDDMLFECVKLDDETLLIKAI